MRLGRPCERQRSALQALGAASTERSGSDVLVVKAPTRTTNPTVNQSLIDDALEKDEAAARAEYLAEFRSDVAVSREAVEALVIPGRRELSHLAGVQYEALCDPSGGSEDSMTLAIAHREGESAVIDALREFKPPFSPESVVEDFAHTIKTYRIARVEGVGLPRFRRHSI